MKSSLYSLVMLIINTVGPVDMHLWCSLHGVNCLTSSERVREIYKGQWACIVLEVLLVPSDIRHRSFTPCHGGYFGYVHMVTLDLTCCSPWLNILYICRFHLWKLSLYVNRLMRTKILKISYGEHVDQDCLPLLRPMRPLYRWAKVVFSMLLEFAIMFSRVVIHVVPPIIGEWAFHCWAKLQIIADKVPCRHLSYVLLLVHL